MKRSLFFAFSLTVLPVFAYAQTSLQTVFKNLGLFINSTIIPFILGLAFLLFVINAFRYFILGGDSDESREKAKSLALYSVLAFFVIIIFWGVINLLASSTGLEGKTAPVPDYVEKNSTASN